MGHSHSQPSHRPQPQALHGCTCMFRLHFTPEQAEPQNQFSFHTGPRLPTWTSRQALASTDTDMHAQTGRCRGQCPRLGWLSTKLLLPKSGNLKPRPPRTSGARPRPPAPALQRQATSAHPSPPAPGHVCLLYGSLLLRPACSDHFTQFSL